MGFKCKPIPVRYNIVIMIFLSTYINYTTRSNLPISLASMVEIVDKKGAVDPVCKREESATGITSPEPSTVSNASGTAIVTEASTTEPKSSSKPFKWKQSMQGQILSAYFYGYVPGSLPAGYISEKFGPFWTLFVSIAIAAVFNSVGVWLVLIEGAGFWLFFVCRIFIGISAGMVYPAVQCLIGQWAPPKERGKFVAAMMGNTLGTCLTWQIVGAVTQAWGWEWGFHVVTLQHIPYLVLLWFLVYDSPEQHKRITEDELKYIKEAQGGVVSKTKANPPYKKIFTSLPFWMLQCLHLGNLYGLYVQIQSVPKFMVEYIGFNIRESGILGSLPNLVRFFTGIGYGVLGDYLKTHKFNREIVLKVGVIFSHVIPGVLMGCMGLVGCSEAAAISLLVLSCAINGAAVLTNLSNPTDLAPNFAGSVFGIISFIGGTTGFIVPAIMTGMIEEMGNTSSTWTWFFVLGGAVYLSCGVIFMVFGTSKTQAWNEKKEDQQEPVATKS